MRKFLTTFVSMVALLSLSVACDDSGKEGSTSMGSGTIAYNSADEAILSAYCQTDEDTIVLFFSPSKVGFDALDTAQYYIRLILDTANADGRALDISKGEALVDIFDIGNENELKALSGSAKVEALANSAYKVSLTAALDDEQSTVSVSFSGACPRVGSVAYANEWVYVHNKVGALTSIIWEAFIDTREPNFWHIYLAPVKDITFDEVSYYSPAKITVPVFLPLDGSKVLLSEDSSISITYGPETWSADNAPQGSIRATYNSKTGRFTSRFTTDGKFKGSYSGPVTIVE